MPLRNNFSYVGRRMLMTTRITRQIENIVNGHPTAGHETSTAIAYAVCAHAGFDPFDTELALLLSQPIHLRNTEVLSDWLTWGFGAAELTEPEALHFVPVFTALFGEYLRSRRH